MMNKILTELKKIMTDSFKEYLPEVSFDRLEDNAVMCLSTCMVNRVKQ